MRFCCILAKISLEIKLCNEENNITKKKMQKKREKQRLE